MTEPRKVDTSKQDAQLEQLLADPDTYWAEARRRAWEQARAERKPTKPGPLRLPAPPPNRALAVTIDDISGL